MILPSLTELMFCFLKAVTVSCVSRASMRACWRSESNGASWRLNVCAASESSWRPSCWSISKMWTGWGRARGVWRWRRRGWKPSRGYCRAGDITARAACLLQYRWVNTRWGKRQEDEDWWCGVDALLMVLCPYSRCPLTAAQAVWMADVHCTQRKLFWPPWIRTTSTSRLTTTSSSFCQRRTSMAVCTAPAILLMLASVPACTTASTPCWVRRTTNNPRMVSHTQTTRRATVAPGLSMTPPGSRHRHRDQQWVWEPLSATQNSHLYANSLKIQSGFCFLMFFPPSPADFSPPLDRRPLDPWMSEVTGHGLFDDDYPSSPSLAPLLPPQAYLSLEGQNGEEAGEENVVYLWESSEKIE